LANLVTLVYLTLYGKDCQSIARGMPKGCPRIAKVSPKDCQSVAQGLPKGLRFSVIFNFLVYILLLFGQNKFQSVLI
jgi:hypothetical protein